VVVFEGGWADVAASRFVATPSTEVRLPESYTRQRCESIEVLNAYGHQSKGRAAVAVRVRSNDPRGVTEIISCRDRTTF
jgi:hypothetical protein